MKTAKFSEAVKRCGKPFIHLAWVDPARDKPLKRALTEHRVMTLHQELHGGKKDFGSVGFFKDRHAQLLVFPKSLREFLGRRIIAIDYALIAKEQISLEARAPEKPERRATQANKSDESHASRSAVPVPRGNIARAPVERPAGENDGQVRRSPMALKKILVEVKRAVSELSTGKSVPAFERLNKLLENNRDVIVG